MVWLVGVLFLISVLSPFANALIGLPFSFARAAILGAKGTFWSFRADIEVSATSGGKGEVSVWELYFGDYWGSGNTASSVFALWAYVQSAGLCRSILVAVVAMQVATLAFVVLCLLARRHELKSSWRLCFELLGSSRHVVVLPKHRATHPV
jgi:hypothetical protein